MSLMHQECKKVRGKCSKADPKEWQRKVSAVLWLFKIRAELRGKPATGWPWQPLLTSSECGTEEMTVVVPRLRKGMVSCCSPAPCWGKCPGSDSTAFFALSKITQPNPKSQTGALWYIKSNLDLGQFRLYGSNTGHLRPLETNGSFRTWLEDFKNSCVSSRSKVCKTSVDQNSVMKVQLCF